jgi:hypothetical protein
MLGGWRVTMVGYLGEDMESLETISGRTIILSETARTCELSSRLDRLKLECFQR